MPKARAPFDYAQYDALTQQGLSQRQIATRVGVPASTIRNNLKVRQARPAPDVGRHEGDSGRLDDALETTSPPLYNGGRQGDHGTPALASGIPLEDLRAVWPVLVEVVAWWQARQQVHPPHEKLTRATFHVAPTWVAAIRREADRTGESYAAVVHRAFAQYFQGREP